MSKVFVMEVNGCLACPFQQRIEEQDAYLCFHGGPGKLIIGGSQLEEAMKQRPDHPLADMPDWCPLEEPKMGFYSVAIPVEEP